MTAKPRKFECEPHGCVDKDDLISFRHVPLGGRDRGFGLLEMEMIVGDRMAKQGSVQCFVITTTNAKEILSTDVSRAMSNSGRLLRLPAWFLDPINAVFGSPEDMEDVGDREVDSGDSDYDGEDKGDSDDSDTELVGWLYGEYLPYA